MFKLTKSGVVSILHQFNGLDGSNPLGGLVQASNGSFYGVASLGGINQQGTLYKLTQQGSTWSFSVLDNFDLWGTGEQPQLTLLQHTNGTLYGDSWFGGTTIEESGGKNQGQGTFYSLSDASLKPFISLIPAGAKVGTSVTVLGQGLDSTTNVSFNGVSAGFTTNQAGTYLTAIVPSSASSGSVFVTTSSGVFKSLKPFIVIPFITNFSPSSGKFGDQVVIMGGGLTGASQVTFGGVKATIFTVNSGSQVTATVPNGAKTGKISIKTAGGVATSSATFTVVP